MILNVGIAVVIKEKEQSKKSASTEESFIRKDPKNTMVNIEKDMDTRVMKDVTIMIETVIIKMLVKMTKLR